MLTPNTFVEPLDMPFSRRGSYICFANDNGGTNQYTTAHLWIATSRLRPTDKNMNNVMSPNSFRQVKVELIKDGIAQKCVIDTTPYEITLRGDDGKVSFCIGDPKYAVGKCEDNLILRLSPLPYIVRPMDLQNGCWKIPFSNYYMLLVPLRGTLRAGAMGSIELLPDENGVFELVCEESLVDPKRRDTYMNYEESLAAVTEDFDSFERSLDPGAPEKYARRTKEAIWSLWGLTQMPDGETVYKRPMVRMMRSLFDEAFSWQHAMYAYFLSKNLDFSWQLLLSSFDNQDSTGKIADALAYNGPGEPTKPPLHGVGFLYLYEHFDLSKRPLEELKFLYNGMEKWTQYHLEYRDLDHDGIYENQSPIETGWEDATYFRTGFPLISPDMNAYLALQEEALAKLGRMIGISEDVCAAWEAKSKDTIEKIIKICWTDEGWTSVNAVTGARSLPTGLPMYCALLLGKRLPQEIIDKSIEIIFREPGFQTPYGLATEDTTSPYFKSGGWCSGGIATPIYALLTVAFENCGRPDLAKKIALEHIELINNAGLFHMIDALNGERNRQSAMTMRGERTLFNSGWTCGLFIFLVQNYAK